MTFSQVVPGFDVTLSCEMMESGGVLTYHIIYPSNNVDVKKVHYKTVKGLIKAYGDVNSAKLTTLINQSIKNGKVK